MLRFVDLNEQCEVVYADNYLDTVAELVEYLNNAEMLISFNGTAFDIPFLQIQFKIPNEVAAQWVMKNFDILEICRKGFGRTFNLNSCLALNKVGSGKTGSGLEAVHQAQRGEWKELEQYCHDDTRLTYELSMLPTILCCENYQWRKTHGQQTHDPLRVLKISTENFPDLTFSYGPVPGLDVEDALVKV